VAVRGVEIGPSRRASERRAPHLHHIFWSFSAVGQLTLFFACEGHRTRLDLPGEPHARPRGSPNRRSTKRSRPLPLYGNCD
jgi:hypothetical protein